MSSTKLKEAIADYLLQWFIEGKKRTRPVQMRIDPSLETFARNALRRQSSEAEAGPGATELRVLALNALLKCHGGDIDSVLLEQLSLELVEVYSRKSQTLEPYLDILIDGGYYTDPDNPIVVGNPMDKEAAVRAWHQEYEGTRHETLLQNIQASFIPATAYANNGMATLIPTIPMNIRAIEEESQGAFPPADATLIEIFYAMINLPDPVQSLFSFFKQLFDIICDLAKDFKRDTFTAELHHYLEDRGRRTKLYTDLLVQMAQNSSKTDVTEVITSFKKLAELFPESEAPVKMIIYIDEAHTLASMTSKGASMYDHMSKATAELHAIHVFFLFLSTTSRFEVLASQATLSGSSRFRNAGDCPIAPFTEMPFDCHRSLAKTLIQPGLALEAIQKFSFAVRFGRPLFWAYFEAIIAGGKDEDVARILTVQMAQNKLMGQPSLSMPKSTGKLAILDTLLNLDYNPQRTLSHKLASKMVAGHLRTVYSVPDSRAYMHTGYPSEPVLAEAALNCVEETVKGSAEGVLLSLFSDLNEDGKGLLSFFSDVNEEGKGGAIYKGERGENVGKMVLLLAYTAAVKRRLEPNTRGRFWGHGCSLIDFLEELTGENFKDMVLKSVPDNLPGGVALEEAFKNSWVRFTHFARAADDSAMTSSMAWVAFIRGMAMIGWHSQQVVDVCIPVLLDKNRPIEEANMTAVLVQFKVREQATTRTNASVDEKKIKIFPPPDSSRDACPTMSKSDKEAYRSRPYISLVMELGLVVTPNGASILSKVVDILDKRDSYEVTPTSQSKHKANLSVSNVHTSSPPARQNQRTSPQNSPRYSLFYYGCSHKVYRCIPDSKRAHQTLRALLQIPNVFNDRPKSRPIGTVLQMKPFWNAGSQCFSWINEPYFNPRDPQIEQGNDEVSIGNESMDVDTDDRSAGDGAMDEDI